MRSQLLLVHALAAIASLACRSSAFRQDAWHIKPAARRRASRVTVSQSSSGESSVEGGTSTTSRNKVTMPGFIDGPSLETKPEYEKLHGPLGKGADKLFLEIFRSRMAEEVGVDSNLPRDDYQGLMELTTALNARYSNRQEVHQVAQNVLRSLFPSWLPGQYAVLFSKPFPVFSARMNAWATKWAGTWLMGECEINDCEIDGGDIGEKQGLLVKRCRFLEESGCASVCVNSCKIPTQNFFMQDMGLPLTMEPDYETGECQFSFGLSPNSAAEFDAKNTPCLKRCPTAGSMRQWHDGGATQSNRCSLMDDDED